MSYEKQNFTNGQVLTAAHLNHIEDGIAAAEQTGGTDAGLTQTEKTHMLTLFAANKGTDSGTLAAYNALATLWGGTPSEPSEQVITVLTTAEYKVWNTATPIMSGYNLPLTPKVNMTVKGLKFKIMSTSAGTLEVCIHDTVDNVDYGKTTVSVVQDTTSGNEIMVTMDVPLIAGRFYKIWVGRTDGSASLYYPQNDEEVENEYFTISRENASDYTYSNPHFRYKGYVMLTV